MSTEAPARPIPETSDVTRRAIRATFDLARDIVADPALLDDIPDGVTLVLVPSDDPELAAAEIANGMAALRRGADVYFRHVRPEQTQPSV